MFDLGAPALQIRSEWKEPSDAYGTSALLRNLAPLLVAYGAVPYLARYSAALAWLSAPVIGLLLYRLTIVMHDCTHATLFRSRMTNRIVGHLMGAVTGIDFEQFRKRHFEHHRNYGGTNDPQGFHYLNIGKMSRPAFGWHVIKPVFGANVRHVFPESYLHPGNAVRMVRSGRFLFVIPIQLGLLAIITDFGSHYWAALFPAVSAATFGLFFSQVRGIAEHGVGDPDRQAGFVRSHASRFLDRLLLHDLNFNLHEEHHRYPQVPSCHLPALHDTSGRSAGTDGMWYRLTSLAG